MSVDINNLIQSSMSQALMKQPKVSAFAKPDAAGTLGSLPLTNNKLEDPKNLKLDVVTKDWRVIPKDST